MIAMTTSSSTSVNPSMRGDVLGRVMGLGIGDAALLEKSALTTGPAQHFWDWRTDPSSEL